MVRRHTAIVRNTSGKGRLGTLFVLMLFAVGAYYGVTVGKSYVQFWRLEQAVRTEVRLAPGITDDTIRRRLRAKVAELGLPDQAYNIQIQRRERPKEIIVKASYQVLLELPFVDRLHTFKIEIRNPL